MAEGTLKTANEVKRQRGRVEEQLGHFLSTVDKLKYYTKQMSQEFNTDDSQLMNELSNLVDRIEACRQYLTSGFEIVMEEMDTYYTQTTANLSQLQAQTEGTVQNTGGTSSGTNAGASSMTEGWR